MSEIVKMDVQELLALLGEREVQLHLLRKENAALRQQLGEKPLAGLPPKIGSTVSKDHAKKG